MKWPAVFLAVSLCAGCGGGTESVTNSSPPSPMALQQALRVTPSVQRIVNAERSAAAVSNDVLMNWAESAVPEVFTGPAPTWTGQGLVYRYYPKSNSYLAIADDGAVALLQPSLRSQIVYLGSAGQYFCRLTTQVSCRPSQLLPIGGDWPMGNYVARNQAEWEQVWALRKPSVNDTTPAPPTFDFSRFMVIGVSMGQGTDCGTFAVLRIIEEDQALRVEYGYQPAPREYVCAAVIGPVRQFVATALSSKRVYFVATAL